MKTSRAAALFGAACCLLGPSCGSAAAATFPTKLFLSSDGVALSSFPSRHVLKQTIRVDVTKGNVPASWTAASDQAWLAVTPSGLTGDDLTVTATAKGLAKDQFYLANVTVSTNGTITDTETLRVGLWVGSSDPATVELSQNALNIATNPVAPVAYVTDGGSSIVEFNVYSGAPIATLKKVAPTVGYLEVSSDGNTLFAADTTNYKIVALDANSGAKLATYPVGYPLNDGFDMVYARPFGQPALYIAGTESGPEGSIVAYPSGEQLAAGIAPTFLAVTPDGRKLYSITTYEEPSTVFAYAVKLRNDALVVSPTVETEIEGENCQDLAVSHDGKHVYPACGWPYQFDVFDGRTLAQVQTLPANPYPNNIEIDAFDHVVGGINGLYQPYDIYVFNQRGYSLGNVDNPSEGQYEGSQTAAMKVSGDGTRVVSATGAVYNSSQTLLFRTMP